MVMTANEWRYWRWDMGVSRWIVDVSDKDVRDIVYLALSHCFGLHTLTSFQLQTSLANLQLKPPIKWNNVYFIHFFIAIQHNAMKLVGVRALPAMFSISFKNIDCITVVNTTRAAGVCSCKDSWNLFIYNR